MKSNSRTAKSLKNGFVAIGFYFINLLLQFFSRKIFLEYLGSEILGLNSTAQNLLQFLNLAELGISTAVSFTLFKPLHDKDTQIINEIVTLQGKLYKRIGFFLLCGGFILMGFFPLIFEKITLPLWYAYAIFIVLLLSALLSYFVNYRQIVLTANQEDYKVQYCYKPVQFIKLVLQIFAVKYLQNGFIWWLALEAAGAIISAFLLRYVTYKSAPYLVNVKRSYKSLSQQYKTFKIKIKQLFIHKISLFALSEIAPLIIYAYLDLTIVTLYVNYQLMFTGVKQLISSTFNSIGAGIGNLVSSSNEPQIIKVFNELFTIRFMCALIVCFCLYNLADDFIKVWIGPEYLLPKSTLILMLIILSIGVIRQAVESFIYAYGLYSDVWAAGTEASLNIGFSILLGYYYGLNGILCGIIISLVVIIMGWKPYFLFRTKLKGYFWKYHLQYLKHIIFAVPVWIFSTFIFSLFHNKLPLNFLDFTYDTLICLTIISLFTFITYYLLTKSCKNFVNRFIKIR